MTIDEYNTMITAVFEELQGISEATANQAWAQVGDASNPAFRSAMARHAQLTKIAAELNDRMLTQMGIKP